ncbi:sensor histidine kinase [Hymenobacter persicinus]|uniref:histidine kinase n=1 Tax=Hymenobacter persicinus TaxID=2025506 RepID=A0A4Q5LF74_9BACT|nr:HAMP domain-containing sensor histidine kinase [Hymenobacter persicinus]RYU83215.1 HAMP domain-containing histidine kinase [Hymenobacter persicinus]
MKLNYRYTIAYAVITLFVLAVGFTIVYGAMSRSVTQTTVGKLRHLNALVARQLASGRDYTGHPARTQVRIRRLLPADPAGPDQLVQVRDEWVPALQSSASVVRLTTYPRVGGQRYGLTSQAVVVRPSDEYLTGIMLVFAWTFVFLLALVVILSEVISWHILKPFNAILRGIERFQLSQKTTIHLQPSRTLEFNVLNEFLMRMTRQAQRDYQGLQEFSENASHELQTPIASMKAQLELLIMDSELTPQQLRMLTTIHDQLERLAKINQALTLLAKLEHYETHPAPLTDLSQLVPATEAAFADLAEMKELRTTQHVAPDVRVPLDESLAQLLLNNLFSNAIRHNLPGGEIRVTLTPAALELRNTGLPPSLPVAELFGRFKKGNAALDSIGIGLAIVQRIGALYHHHLAYTYADGWHCLRVEFAPEPA